MINRFENETYTEKEWNGAIASMGRLVDIRNFPDVAADVLLGKRLAFLGRGYQGKPKVLNPEIIGALTFWTKGPVELLIEHPGLREVLELYNSNHAVIGLQLSVTGFGGTLLEPGIQSPEEVAAGLPTPWIRRRAAQVDGGNAEPVDGRATLLIEPL